ncbi:uncharacterized protein LOC100251812 isoform X2 [Vitis vinifera]|uniref:uncharacterized protein LOC100251812 isoform X2 n=1 Tax=Vitis vinifera TaxID=29760 RepID=UPI00053F576C|nr:uncharacterized protein LOC100251812 isoform X2 [Vitis vinifera]|eukprot:XP_010646012.1 PREDICTED: uncharacterized protein LOC100251812 isoform X2 [Vitis vinifera]
MASHRRRPFQRPPQSLRSPSRAENLPSSGTRVPMDEVRSSNQVLIDEMDSSNPVNVFGSISSDQAKQVHLDKNPSDPLAVERSQTYNEEWQRLRRWAATQLHTASFGLICIILGVILMILAPIGALRQIILQAKTFEVFS